jgi:NAD(P)H dehydrogenase (quinone)
MDEVAGELSGAAGRTITYQAETLEEAYASRASYGAPDWEVAGWVTTCAAIANGDLEAVSGDVAAGDGAAAYARVRALRTRAISRSASRLARDWRLS